ncbi:MAG: hypothetical protein WC994_10195 [Brumimicrobium sp.]
MNLQEIKKPTFINKLLEKIEGVGVPRNNIEAIFVVGSGLYLTNPQDLDLKVIVKRYYVKAEIGRNFVINGEKVQCHYYTKKDWANIKKYKKDAQYIAEAHDMELIHGSGEGVVRHDVLTNKENQKYLIDIWGKHFFEHDPEGKLYKFDKKRLWNFILFANKVNGQTHEITNAQKLQMDQAHEGLIDIEDLRPTYNSLKALIQE